MATVQHKDLTGAELHDPKAHQASHAEGGADPIVDLEQQTADVDIKKASPAFRMIGTEGSAIDCRVVETAGNFKIQYRSGGSEASPVWTDMLSIDSSGNITVSGTVDGIDPSAHKARHSDGGADAIVDLEVQTSEVELKMATPFVRWIGTETSAKDFRIAEDAGLLKIQHNTGSEGSPTWTDRVVIDMADGAITIDEISAPSTPASGKVVVYPKTDGLMYSKDDAGAETLMSGGPAALSLLHAGSGTDATAAATTVDSIAISGLTALDRILVYVSVGSTTQDTAEPFIYHVTDTENLATVINAVCAAGKVYTSFFELSQDQGTATHMLQRLARAFGNTAAEDDDGGTGNTVTGDQGSNVLTTAWTGSWTLGLRHGGVTSGGTFRYNWAVYKLAGQ